MVPQQSVTCLFSLLLRINLKTSASGKSQERFTFLNLLFTFVPNFMDVSVPFGNFKQHARKL